MRSLLTFLMSVLLVAGSTARASVRAHQLAEVSLFVPDGWAIADHEDRMTASSGEDVALLVLALPERPLEDSLAGLDERLRDDGIYQLSSSLASHASPRTIHGMRALFSRVPARRGQLDIEVSAQLVETPNRRTLLLLGCTRSQAQLRGVVDKIFASPQPWK